MAVHTSSVVCAWCNRTIVKAALGSPVSHIICRNCANWTFTHDTLALGGAQAVDADYFDFPPRGEEPMKMAKH